MEKTTFTIWEKLWHSIILQRVGNSKGNIMVECSCICWTIFITRLSDLRSWRQKSCWCHQWWKTHWMKWTRIYNIWCGMKSRCNDKNQEWYKYYWWKGIKVCEKWIKFDWFIEDMYKSYEKHLAIYWSLQTTIDRIDWKWNYCKENCRRATRKEQTDNRCKE